MTMIRSFNELTPMTDKALSVLGAVTSATIGLTDVSTSVGIVVGVTTLCMIIPRAMLNWDEWQQTRIKRANEKQRGKDANANSSDY